MTSGVKAKKTDSRGDQPGPDPANSLFWKLTFFLLLSIVALLVTLKQVDYQPGDLKSAYVAQVPEEIRVHLDHYGGVAKEVTSKAVADFNRGYVASQNFIRSYIKDVNINGVNLDEFLFPDEVYDEKIQEQKEALEKMQKAVEEMNKKIEADKKLKEEAERKAKEEAEKQRLKKEQEAKAAAEKARREDEAKKAAEKARKEAEEAQKKAAEKARQEQEEAKKAAEKAKKEAEEAQKKAAEKARQEQEEAKKAADKAKKEEESKKAAEKAKKEAEEARKATEKARKEEEEARKAAEKAKRDEEAKKAQDEQRQQVEEKERKKRAMEEEIKRKEEQKAAKAAEKTIDRTDGETIGKRHEAKAAKAKKTLPKTDEDRLKAAKRAAEKAKASDQQDSSYDKQKMTNDQDMKIRDSLDQAEVLISTNPQAALDQFESILAKHPKSPRAFYGKGRALDSLAESKRSNEFLEKAIATYIQALSLDVEVPKDLFLIIGYRCVDRMKFRGWNLKAENVLKTMLQRFPHDLGLMNELGTLYLIQGKNAAAEEMFEKVLEKDQLNSYAAKHLGFILKTKGNNESDLTYAVQLLAKGLETDPNPEGKFYYHLGEGLRRLGREEEANKVYQEGTNKGLFLSFWQRSLYNVDSLRGQPVWTKQETGQAEGLDLLEQNWQTIRDEALALLNQDQSGFQPEAENLQDQGDWKQFELFRQGRRLNGCTKAPKTCSLLSKIPAAITNKRGQIKFSIMKAGTHVHPHSGPTNCRLRAHLGLKVPPASEGGDLKLRVADQFLTWQEGRFFIFDDSFDHEVWHQRKSDRIVLIVDLWHPDLDESTKKSLMPI